MSSQVTVCGSALGRRNGHGGPQRSSEVEGRTSRVPSRGVSEFLSGSAQGTQSSVAPSVAVPFEGWVSPSPPPRHLAHECYQGGDFHPGRPASDLPRSTAEVCPDGSISIDGEGLSQAGRGLSEQLLPGLPASNLTGLPRQALAVRSPGSYPDGCIHALPPPTKYKDILRMVEMDLKALQDPLPAAPREA